MTIEEFKIRLKNNKSIVFYSNNVDLLRELEEILLSNGWLWASQFNKPKSLIDNYLNDFLHKKDNCVFCLFSHIYSHPSRNYLTCTILNNTSPSLSDMIELTEEVFGIIEKYFNPKPTYKPKTFDKNI